VTVDELIERAKVPRYYRTRIRNFALNQDFRTVDQLLSIDWRTYSRRGLGKKGRDELRRALASQGFTPIWVY